MLSGWLRRLVGGTPQAEEEPVTEDYGDYTLTAEPVRESGGWRVAGRISLGTGPNRRDYSFQRADMSPNRDDIVSMTLRKARQLVDEQGDTLFRDPPGDGQP